MTRQHSWHRIVLDHVDHEAEVLELALQLDVVHQTLQGRHPCVVKLSRLGVIFEYPGVGRKVTSLLQLPDGLEAGGGDDVAVAGQQLLHVEVPGDLLQHALRVLGQVLRSDISVVLN